VPTLRDRLPADLHDAPAGPEFPTLPFRSLYLTDTEWAAELANQTVHSVLHMGWVPDGAGGYRGQMAVLVKPNGLFGKGYFAAIQQHSSGPVAHAAAPSESLRGDLTGTVARCSRNTHCAQPRRPTTPPTASTKGAS
jgi:hypothetical protein